MPGLNNGLSSFSRDLISPGTLATVTLGALKPSAKPSRRLSSTALTRIGFSVVSEKFIDVIGPPAMLSASRISNWFASKTKLTVTVEAEIGLKVTVKVAVPAFASTVASLMESDGLPSLSTILVVTLLVPS